MDTYGVTVLMHLVVLGAFGPKVEDSNWNDIKS